MVLSWWCKRYTRIMFVGFVVGVFYSLNYHQKIVFITTIPMRLILALEMLRMLIVEG